MYFTLYYGSIKRKGKSMKLAKLIICNIILLVLLLFAFDLYVANKYWRLGNDLKQYYTAVFKTLSVEKYLTNLLDGMIVDNTYTYKFRPDVNTNSTKKSIILCGCSFTYGDGLSDEKTFSNKLGIFSDRPIYNRAGMGWGLSHFLFLTDFNYFYQKHTEPEYLIYVYIDNHLNRINKFKVEPLFVDFQPRYKYKNEQLNIMNPKLFDRLVFVETYQYNSFDDVYNPELFPKILKAYFKQANENIRRHWKNTKLVILKYPTDEDSRSFNHEIWKEIEEMGITVIDSSELTTINLRLDKYKVDGLHPTAEAWDAIIPELVKKLNL